MARIYPKQIIPGSNGQILTTSGGVAGWAPLSSISGTIRTRIFNEITVDTTTTSATFVTLLTSTFSTLASILQIHFTISSSSGTNNREGSFRLTLDGTPLRGLGIHYQGGGDAEAGAILYQTGVITAASHTVAVEWKRGASSTTLSVRPVGDPDDEHASLLINEITP